MPRKLDPKIIRPGDTVRIINPEMFVRCGYPISLTDVYVKIEKEYEDFLDKIIEEFHHRVLGDEKTTPLLDSKEWEFATNYSKSCSGPFRNKTKIKLTYALAYEFTHFKGFGGTTRKIYTKTEEDLRDKEFKVYSTFKVNTGDYYPPSYCPPSYDEMCGEWNPGGLENMKSHKILELCDPDFISSVYTSPVQIEAKNVRKLENGRYPRSRETGTTEQR